MNSARSTQVITEQPPTTLLASGSLQRKCACGQHTQESGECLACRNENFTRSLQTKLQFAGTNDKYEQEADRTAEQILRMPEPSNGDINKYLNTNVTVQRQVSNTQYGVTYFPEIVHDVLRSPGQPLDQTSRDFMEPRFGYDFSNLRIHNNNKAGASSKAISARAYTVGNNIAFSPGEYKPDTTEGKQLLAHELTHVIQQNNMPGSQRILNKKDDKGKKKTTQFAAKDIAEFKFEPSINGAPCACLVFVHNNEKSAKKIAGLMHQHCRYNFASVQTAGRCIPMPGEPAKGSCKKGSIDPNELFPKTVAEKCANDNKTCRDFVDKNKNSTDAAVIKEVEQHNYFLAISDCSNNFTLPVVALHNNDINDTTTFKKELKKKRPKQGSTNKKEIEKGKKFEELLNKLKVTIDKTSTEEKKSGSDDLTTLKELLKKEFKATDKSILFGQRGKTNIFRWCTSDELAKCHPGDPEHPDDVVWTTNESDFKTLSEKDINVVLQAKPTSSGKAKGKSKKGESDTDLSTLFLFLEQISNQQIMTIVENLTQEIQRDIEDILQIIQRLKSLTIHEDLLPVDILNGTINILFKIMEIINQILLLLAVNIGGSARTSALRFINIETGGNNVDPKKDPAKFDFITNVLEPLGLNCCDKGSEGKVRSGLEPKE